MRVARACLTLLLTGVIGLALAACGGGGQNVPTALPSIERPTAATEEPTSSAEAQEPTSQTPRPTLSLPTRSEAAAPTSDPPATESAPTTPTRAAEPTPALASTPTPAPATAAPPSSTPTSSSSVWWLVALLAVIAAVLVGVWLARRQRAQRTWDAQLAALVAESAWLAHELLPRTLSTTSPATRSTTWMAYRPRVDALATKLSDTATSAPEDRWDEVEGLRAAVSDLRAATDVYAMTTAPEEPSSLAAVQQAQRRLEAAIHTVQQGPGVREG